MIDELKCRIVSLADYILGKEDKFLILDDNKNMYKRGRKIKAHKIDNHGFKKEDGWDHILTDGSGVKHYRKF